MRLFFSLSYPSLNCTCINRCFFLFLIVGQVWLTALRRKGKGKEILVSFKANHTAVTLF